MKQKTTRNFEINDNNLTKISVKVVLKVFKKASLEN